jgi:hypothetical protein
MWFVGGSITGIRTDHDPEDEAGLSSNIPPPASEVTIGDYVRCTGQFAAPRKVVWLLDGGRYLCVQGNPIRLRTTEVRIVDPPPPPFQGDLSDDTLSPQPAFPVFGFGWAIQRTRDLLECAGREWVSLGQAASVWYPRPERGAILQSLAGLLAFGLAEQSGSGSGSGMSGLASWDAARSKILALIYGDESGPRRHQSHSSLRITRCAGAAVDQRIMSALPNWSGSMALVSKWRRVS